MRRPIINITPVERIARVLWGLAGVLAGAVLLVIQDGVALTVAGALLVLAGLDLVVTGAIGLCPLYRRLGYVPSSLRRP